MSKEQMDIAWEMFNQVVRNAQLEKECEKKWEEWKKVTWQSRRFQEKAHNLTYRMRAL